VLRSDDVLGVLSRREHDEGYGFGRADPAIRLLTALVDDVDQWLSSVSITPST
jgi:hypothetical protein